MADNLKDLLNGLGETADEVASFLEGQGIKGHRARAKECPVAIYLSQATGERSECGSVYAVIHKGPTSITELPSWRASTQNTDVQLLPPPVQLFVHKFDWGGYPALDSPDSPWATNT